jgi:prevent-host-death family protein
VKSIPMSEAARRLTVLLKAVESGEEFILTRAGKPVAKLTRADESQGERSEPEGGRRLRSLGWRDHPEAPAQTKPHPPKQG